MRASDEEGSGEVSGTPARYIINERFFIDRDRRPSGTVESWHFGVFSPTGETVQLGDGRVGRVVNYLGGGDTLEDALRIVDEAATRLSHRQASLF